MVFITSISPNHNNFENQFAAVKSWQKRGKVISINSTEEIKLLSAKFDNVLFVENINAEKNKATYGKPFANVTSLFDAAKNSKEEHICFINSDIIIDCGDLNWADYEDSIKENTLTLSQRYNYTDTILTALKENDGIDVFSIHSSVLDLLPKESRFMMGQCWWDYWLPYHCMTKGVSISFTESPLFFHKNHARQWSEDSWFRMADVFLHETNHPSVPTSTLGQFSRDIIAKIKKYAEKKVEVEEVVVVTPTTPTPKVEPPIELPSTIEGCINLFLSAVVRPVIFELGIHRGEDTRNLSKFKDSVVHAFECDARNLSFVSGKLPHNVILNPYAIHNEDGDAEFHVSEKYVGVADEWSQSGSLKKPKDHLRLFPNVKFFEKTATVKTITLDTYCDKNKIDHIDFIWADIQGNEDKMFLGGKKILKNTKYIYTEYCDDEIYEGQLTLNKLAELIPDFKILKIFPLRFGVGDVLFANKNLIR